VQLYRNTRTVCHFPLSLTCTVAVQLLESIRDGDTKGSFPGGGVSRDGEWQSLCVQYLETINPRHERCYSGAGVPTSYCLATAETFAFHAAPAHSLAPMRTHTLTSCVLVLYYGISPILKGRARHFCRRLPRNQQHIPMREVQLTKCGRRALLRFSLALRLPGIVTLVSMCVCACVCVCVRV